MKSKRKNPRHQSALREKDAFESQYLRELERDGPNGIGATVFDGLSVEHWDGSETSQPRTLTMEKTK